SNLLKLGFEPDGADDQDYASVYGAKSFLLADLCAALLIRNIAAVFIYFARESTFFIGWRMGRSLWASSCLQSHSKVIPK
ncbi:unnamed protein product, partial [Ixodes pacificus]